MTKKLRMTLFGMATFAAIAAPVALAVSCGGDSSFHEVSIDGKEDGTISFSPFAVRAKEGTSSVINPGDYKAQLILDGHDHSENDHAFNQAAFEAINSISSDGVGVAGTNVTKATTVGRPSAPSAPSDFATTYTSASKNTIMVMTGFMHVDPLNLYLKSNDAVSQNKYAILLDGDVANARVASVNFQAHQAGFEAGVLAGFYLNVNKERFGDKLKVATFGGLDIPTVTGSMVGFQKGVEWFNANNKAPYDTDIEFIDNGNKADYYSGGFAPGQGRTIADKLVSGGADLIYPVAGAQAADVKASIKSKRSPAQIIGVDSAQELDPNFGDIVAFSALKDLKAATTKVLDVITGAHSSTEDGYHGIEGLGGQTLGDLENGLVGVSKGSTTDEIYALATSATVKEAALALDDTAKFNW